jgi:hypothetical protein
MSPDNDTFVREFVEAFNTKDNDRKAPYPHPDVVVQTHGDGEVRGREPVDAVLNTAPVDAHTLRWFVSPIRPGGTLVSITSLAPAASTPSVRRSRRCGPTPIGSPRSPRRVDARPRRRAGHRTSAGR